MTNYIKNKIENALTEVLESGENFTFLSQNGLSSLVWTDDGQGLVAALFNKSEQIGCSKFDCTIEEMTSYLVENLYPTKDTYNGRG